MALIEQRFATVMDSTRPQPGGGVITEQLDSQLGGLALQAPGSATEALNISYEINRILDCGLDKETLSICIALLENGVNPEVGTDQGAVATQALHVSCSATARWDPAQGQRVGHLVLLAQQDCTHTVLAHT